MYNQEKATQWLKLYDKHLWGINANYKEVCKLAPRELELTPVRLTRILWDLSIQEVEENGEVKKKKLQEYTGVLKWYKSPDECTGPRKSCISKKRGLFIALSSHAWDRLKQFTAEKKAVFMEPDSTVAFAIRMFRRSYLPANEHIISEVFGSKKIPLRTLPLSH